MKNLYLFLLFTITSALFTNSIFAQCDGITVESLTNPGPYEVATLTEADGIRNGPDYNGATVYYPTNATPPFASIAIVPGFTAAPSSVAEWGPFYASHGIVAIIIGTNSPFDFPEARALALLDALETIRQENVRVSSPLEGALNLEQLAVSGWSMGGGGAQRAAVLDNYIAGVVALCPYLTSPQLNHESPVLIFSGEADTVAPPAQHADIHYNVTPSTTDKLLFEIANGNHSVANSPNGGNGTVGKIALSWLKLYVEDNDCYCPLLTETLLVDPPAASKVEQDFNCELLGIPLDELVAEIYPNPSDSRIFMGSTTQPLLKVELYTTLGEHLLRLEGNVTSLDVSNFASGIYVIKLFTEKGVTTQKVIKR
ncbi:T9SS type A sorting domain-containing protein [Altibacter sp.]|uniref:poly(ethylene terephthalate) hydrolase family protein n=1 Tax=Altibacter sp. TaxID=2024823 RepID=UPI00258F26BC|nr:T9SS type A sorting domain-containing protein [Altibacter sp.]MCW9038657.1 T9SS type A sorting domain-containing protein [Altibacter sp.]